MNIVKKQINLKRSIKSELERHPVPILGKDYRVKIIYKNTKIIELDVEGKNIIISLPNQYKKLETSQILKILVEKLYAKVAEQEIERAMERTRLLLGIAPEDYSVKPLNNNMLAQCITDEKKIVINPAIAMYDRNVIDYLVLHEFCHLKYKIHTKNFWKIIQKYMPSYPKYETILKDYVY